MDFLAVTIWVLILVLIIGLLILVWNNGQLRARLDALERALEKQADQFMIQLGQVEREATLKIAAMRNEWADTRQRWTLTGSHLSTAKNWIRMLVATLRQHNIAVPIPDNIEEIPRQDETVHFPEIEAAAEYRLDDLIAEVAEANKLEDRGPLNG
jgi:hypothetical protein